MPNDLTPPWRFPLLITGMLSLVMGMMAGLARVGVAVPEFVVHLAWLHSVLMIPAFFGTVISLERAVALARFWAYFAPLSSALGAVFLLLGLPLSWAGSAFLLSSLIFIVASWRALQIQFAIQNLILLGGAGALLLGNIGLLVGVPVSELTLWWMGFILLTIAGERLELSRLVVRSEFKRRCLAGLCLVPVMGAFVAWMEPSVGQLIFAVGMAGMGVWLLAFDIARRTVRMQGLTRFTAVCMLTGYLWLLGSALFFVVLSVNTEAHAYRDAALHSFFLGFVFTMVMGHALLIFPAVTRLKMPYSPWFYLPLCLLHGSLMLRILGPVDSMSAFLVWGARLNVLAIVAFLLLVLATVIRGRKKAIPKSV